MRWTTVLLLSFVGIAELMATEANEQSCSSVQVAPQDAIQQQSSVPHPVSSADESNKDSDANRSPHLRKTAEHLLPAGLNSLANHSPGDVIIRDILKDWTQRQSKFSTVRCVLQGEAVVTRGAYSNDPGTLEQMPSDVSGDVPPEDYKFDFDITLIIDFNENRVRREYNRETFYLDEVRFIPDSEVGLFDGKLFQNYAPLAANTSPRYRPLKYQPELTLGGTKAPLMFFRPIDKPVFLALGIIPTGKTPLTPRELKLSLSESYFSFGGKSQYKDKEVIILTYRTSPRTICELWVDLSRDSSIVRAISKHGSQETGRLEIAHQKTNNGWYPKSWTWTTFDAQNRISSIDTVSVIEMAFDEMFDASQFYVEPTPGMVVRDRVRDIRYVQGKSGHPNTIIDSHMIEEIH